MKVIHEVLGVHYIRYLRFYYCHCVDTSVGSLLVSDHCVDTSVGSLLVSDHCVDTSVGSLLVSDGVSTLTWFIISI